MSTAAWEGGGPHFPWPWHSCRGPASNRILGRPPRPSSRLGHTTRRSNRHAHGCAPHPLFRPSPTSQRPRAVATNRWQGTLLRPLFTLGRHDRDGWRFQCTPDQYGCLFPPRLRWWGRRPRVPCCLSPCPCGGDDRAGVGCPPPARWSGSAASRQHRSRLRTPQTVGEGASERGRRVGEWVRRERGEPSHWLETIHETSSVGR